MLIPYLSEKKAVLPVVVIMIKQKGEVFLVEREKRPFKGKLALPAGRIILGERIQESVTRIMKEKYFINAEIKKTCSLSLEQVKDEGKIVHSFMLILVIAKTKDKLVYSDPKKLKNRIIKSDYELIINDSKKNLKIKEFNTKDL